MIGEETPRDLAALIVPRAGRLEQAEDPWEPYRLCDPAGMVVGPVAVYLRDLQASARPETTLRAYATALLRWFRFLWAIEVPWDQVTRAEARDCLLLDPAGCQAWSRGPARRRGRCGQGGPHCCGPGRRPGRGTQSGDREGAARPWLRAGDGQA